MWHDFVDSSASSDATTGNHGGIPLNSLSSATSALKFKLDSAVIYDGGGGIVWNGVKGEEAPSGVTGIDRAG